MVRKTRGRQKIEMKKIEKRSNLQVTFSKRKFGVFKKASELATLCGVQILMIMSSPSGKYFSFGSSNVHDLINQFKFGNYNRHSYQQSNNNQQFAQVGPDPHIQNLNNQLTEEGTKQEELVNDKKTLIEIQEKRKEKRNWWEKDENDMNSSEIHEFIPHLQDLENFLSNLIPQHSQENVVHHQNYFDGDMLNNNVVAPANMIGVGNFNGGLNYMNQGEMMMNMHNAYDYNQNTMMSMHNAYDHNQDTMMHMQNTYNPNQDMMMPMHNAYNRNQDMMMPIQNAYDHNENMMMSMENAYDHNRNMMLPNYHGPTYGYDINNNNTYEGLTWGLNVGYVPNYNFNQS